MNTAILASTPTSMSTGKFYCSNQQFEIYKRYISSPVKLLFICADPEDYDHNDAYSQDVCNWFRDIGFQIECCYLLDRRADKQLRPFLEKCNVIYLAGGHVPTQNDYMNQIGLAGYMDLFHGTIIGCSAGSMNAAAIVYAEPELEGESTDPNYQRFIRGLGLTDTMIIPHAYSVMNATLDGKKRLEQIVLPDSEGKCFLLLPDGSYLLCTDTEERVFGEAYLVQNGKIELFSTSSGSRLLRKKSEA